MKDAFLIDSIVDRRMIYIRQMSGRIKNWIGWAEIENIQISDTRWQENRDSQPVSQSVSQSSWGFVQYQYSMIPMTTALKTLQPQVRSGVAVRCVCREDKKEKRR